MMKNILLILFMFFSISAFSQQIPNIASITDTSTVDSLSYPMINIDSLGNKIVILTLEQAKKIDNKLDLLELIRLSNNLSEDIDSVCVRVINEKNQVIADQDIQISKLDLLVSNKDEQIENLKRQISNQLLTIGTFQDELNNKDQEIQLHLDRISDLEKKTLWGGIGGGIVITILTTLLLTK